MKERAILGAVAALTLATGALSAGEGRIPIHAATTIASPGRYILTRDIGDFTATTITISASDVDLDLNGFTVTGLDPAISAQNVRGVTIHDGSIVSYEDGVILTNVNDFALRRLIVQSFEDCGLSASGTGGVIQENVIQASVYGICLSGSGVRVAQNVVRGAAIDGVVVYGARNHIEGNLATANGGCGLHFANGSSSNVYRSNTARGNAAAPCCLGGTTDFCDQGTGNSSNGDNFMPAKF
jgi:hypothetical protein